MSRILLAVLLMASVLRGAAAPDGFTYQAVSTPDRKQARQLFDANGNPVGPVEYAWHNPTLGWDGTSFAGIGEAGNVRYGAAAPGSDWTAMGIDTSDFINGSDLMTIGAMAAPVGLQALSGVAGMSAGAFPTTSGAASAWGGSSLAASGSAAAGSSGGGMWDWLDNLGGPEGIGGSESIHLGSGLPYGATEDGIYAAMDAGDAAVGSGMTASGYMTPNPLMSIPGYGDVYSGLGTAATLRSIMGTAQGAAALKSLMNKGGGNTINFGPGSNGGGLLDGIANDPLGAAFSATPFLLALTEANKQGKDIDQVLNEFRGNESGYMQSVLRPYDMDTAAKRTELLTGLGERGVSGSSFGNQQLGNFDYLRDVGRGDLTARAKVSTFAPTLDAITKRNTNRNMLLGAGLNASGRLFQPQQSPLDLFGLRNLVGV